MCSCNGHGLGTPKTTVPAPAPASASATVPPHRDQDRMLNFIKVQGREKIVQSGPGMRWLSMPYEKKKQCVFDRHSSTNTCTHIRSLIIYQLVFTTLGYGAYRSISGMKQYSWNIQVMNIPSSMLCIETCMFYSYRTRQELCLVKCYPGRSERLCQT